MIRKLYVEASSRCNLNCKMCFRRSWVDERFGDLEPALFYRLLEEPVLADDATVFFGGMGEPLIHPQIVDMVRAAAACGKRTELVTNGTLLREEIIRRLLDSGIGRIWVSIDEIYENYGKIQIGSDFELVRGNIRTYNRLRRGTEAKLGMTAVVMRDNIGSLRRIKAFAEAFEADDLNLSHMLPIREEDKDQTLWSMCDISTPVFSWYIEDYQKDRPMFRFRPQDEEKLFGSDHQKALDAALFSWKGKPFTRRTNYCRFIEEKNCFIRWDGDVSPCMGLLHSSDVLLGEHKRCIWHASFGNLHERMLSAVWNSEAYTAFRRRVEAFSFSPCLYCSGCEDLCENRTDCIGSPSPTCGGCLWGQGFVVCP